MAPSSSSPYRGVFPVAPTIFDDRGELDLDGQRRCIDFMIDAGSHGICILANFSEQFVLTDAEREQVMDAVLKRVAGRVPVVVTNPFQLVGSVPRAAVRPSRPAPPW
jgi:4-hydroxy-tetrahydrodipicolinate synthase